MPSSHNGCVRSAEAEPSHVRRALDYETVEAGIAEKPPLIDALSAARLQRSRSGDTATSPTALRLLAQGDSWLDHRPTDMADRLRQDGGHKVTSLAISSSTLEQAVYGALPRDHLGVAGAHQVSRAEDLIYALQSVQPRAVVLSAGGNDVKGDALSLLGSALASPAGVDTAAVRRYVRDAFAQPYIDLVRLITTKAERMGQRVPIVIHGYDYPRVSERARWLAAPLGHSAGQLLESVGRALVDAFDAVLSELAD